MKLQFPVNYIYISQGFSNSHKSLDLGWSIEGLCGGQNQPIYAPGKGVVEEIYKDYKTQDSSGSSYGNYILIKHNSNFKSRVAHLKYGSLKVKKGDKVIRGQRIATMGATGHATGNHTHYEVIKDNKKVDPLLYTYYLDNQIIDSQTKDEYNLKKWADEYLVEFKANASKWYKIFLYEGETLLVKE